MKTPILCLAALSLAACSTDIKNARSADYAPVYPVNAPVDDGLMPTGAIYGGGAAGLFATDRRAAQVGDILTVELSENFAASKSQGSSTSKTDNYGVDIPDLLTGGFDDALLGGGSSSSFSGTGSATQSNSLTGRMSVSVVRVFPGGNLEILGQKKLTLNNGDEYIRLSGIVRQADISSGNIVQSERIANAEIKYSGAGQIADAGKKGWLSQTLDTISPF